MLRCDGSWREDTTSEIGRGVRGAHGAHGQGWLGCLEGAYALVSRRGVAWANARVKISASAEEVRKQVDAELEQRCARALHARRSKHLEDLVDGSSGLAPARGYRDDTAVSAKNLTDEQIEALAQDLSSL